MEGEMTVRILLVDDDMNLLDYYRRVLGKRMQVSIDIDICCCGSDLERKLSQAKYDIIILDQRLSDGERGIDLVPLISATSPETRIILNSAYGNEDLAVESLRRGVDDYVCGNKENDDLLVDALHRVMGGITLENRISDIISKEKRELMDLTSCCRDKMRRLRERVSRMNDVIASV